MNRMKTSNNYSISGGVQFSVDIRYQQHSSWQGSIQRLDTGEKIHFRSQRELLSLIESAVSRHLNEKGEEEILRQWQESKKGDEQGKENAI
ncbi:MAG: hypothetical protein D5S00_10225 [Tindallia sp. MSAO_Bac2]|nr:MAG: hypothetical protein D5S00_10225 [Tindallia sp. MSAO_Bac2]